MKVKYINIYNEIKKQYQTSHHNLTIGNEYVILEIFIHPGKNILYRLVGDNTDKSPALYNASQFAITSDKIPSNWSMHQLEAGSLIIGPKAWGALGFWEDCYDLDEKALEIYKCEATIIYQEEGILLN